MLKRYLVVTKANRGHFYDEKVITLEQENEVKDLVGRIAAGNYSIKGEPETLEYIYEVDLWNGKMKRLEPALENMKIVLKEMKK